MWPFKLVCEIVTRNLFLTDLLSSLLDVHGPSITVDTACSSGLIALHEGILCQHLLFTVGELSAAVKYLQSGEGESAIVCGANVHCWYVLPFPPMSSFYS